MRPLLGALGGVAVVALLLASPAFANQGLVFLIGLAVVEALFALSWNFLFRFSGIASFGHATFYAIGGYTTGYLLKYPVIEGGLLFPLALLASALLAAAVAFAIGFVALRRNTGITFAIITLAVSEIAVRTISYSVALGRDDGMSGIPRPTLGVGPWTVSLVGDQAYFTFMVLFCAALALVLWWLVHSEFGRVMRAISFDSERARFLGIDIRRYRIVAFVVSGAIAAAAGAVAVPWVQIITPETANYVHSTQPMLSSLLGGFTYFWGPVLGAAVFAGINYATRTLAGLSDLVTGGVLLAIVLLVPFGIAGLVARLAKTGRREATHPLAHAKKALQ